MDQLIILYCFVNRTVSSGKQKGLKADQAKLDRAKHLSDMKEKVVTYVVDSSDSGFSEDRDQGYDDAAELHGTPIHLFI